MHRFDQEVEMEETILAVKYLFDTGKIFYWGTSEWPNIRIMQAMYLCDKLGCPRPVAEQCEYNMLQRDQLEKNYLPLIEEFGLGSTVYSPLCCGILTGKYNEGEIPEGSRFKTSPALKNSWFFDRYLGEKAFPETQARLKKLQSIADRLECTMAQLALAWNISWDGCSCAIMGVSSVEQLISNLKAMDIKKKLTKELLKEIEDAIQTAPLQDIHSRNFPLTAGQQRMPGPRDQF